MSPLALYTVKVFKIVLESEAELSLKYVLKSKLMM